MYYRQQQTDSYVTRLKDKNGIHLSSTNTNRSPLLKVSDKKYEQRTEKIISFIDLAGHEKYLKTTVYGVTGLFPDYGIVVIGANTGITKLTREHIGILFYLKIPFIICITKIDLAPSHVYKKLCNRLKNLLTKILKAWKTLVELFILKLFFLFVFSII